MTSTELQNLVRVGLLKPEPPDRAEFEALIESGEVRLKDARNKSLAIESRFDLAYNAAHALSLAALRWHGYRAAQRYVVFQALPHTLSLSATEARVLAKCHQLRNSAEYEGAAEIGEPILADLLKAADAVSMAVSKLGSLK
jgi:hypothetical protein